MSDLVEAGVARMAHESTRASPTDVLRLLDLMCELLGVTGGSVLRGGLLARRLQQIDSNGPVGLLQPIAGTLIGRVFTSGQVQSWEPTRPLCWCRWPKDLADNIISFSDVNLYDDATMLLIEYRPPSS